jgi:hypothetical protein
MKARLALLAPVCVVVCQCSSGKPADPCQGATNPQGTSCSPLGITECASDCAPWQSTVLECLSTSDGGTQGGTSSGTWQPVYTCRNGQACSLDNYSNVYGDFVFCGANRFPVAPLGGACSIDKDNACSFDQSALLVCTRGQWVVSQTCGGSQTCNGFSPGCPSSAPYCLGCN